MCATSATQLYAVLGTQSDATITLNLMAFAATEDLRFLIIVTERRTAKDENLRSELRVAVLVGNRANQGIDTQKAMALGMAAIAQAISVYFVSIVDLIEMIHKDAKEDRLGHRLNTLCRPKLLILDEMGYFSLDR